MRESLRILLADDHAVVREGLRALLAFQPGMEVVGEAADGKQAVALAAALSPDVVLLDISMPVMDGIEAAAKLRRAMPDLLILMVSINDDPGNILDAFKAGADGYVIKDEAAEQLVGALESVSRRSLYCSNAVRESLRPELAGADGAEKKILARLLKANAGGS